MESQAIPNLHNQEVILYQTRSSRWALTQRLLEGVLQGLIFGLFLALCASVITFLAAGQIYGWLVITLIVIGVAALLARHYIIWKQSTFTITSHRLLFNVYDINLGHGDSEQRHKSILRSHNQAVRWDLYQESLHQAGILEGLGNVGSLTIRYGTADGARRITMRFVPYANDLKHYLDKIQAMRASGMPAQVLPGFVAAKRGRRDETTS